MPGTLPRRGWQIQFRRKLGWYLSGTWPRSDARAALANLRSDYSDAEWRLIWNGLVQDPLPLQPRTIKFARMAFGDQP